MVVNSKTNFENSFYKKTIQLFFSPLFMIISFRRKLKHTGFKKLFCALVYYILKVVKTFYSNLLITLLAIVFRFCQIPTYRRFFQLEMNADKKSNL